MMHLIITTCIVFLLKWVENLLLP